MNDTFFHEVGSSGKEAAGVHSNTPLDPLNHYDVLDIEPTATRVEIREAFLRLKNTYSAGSAALYGLVGEEEAREQLARAEEAFRILSDDVARRTYDQRLGLVAASTLDGDSSPRHLRAEPVSHEEAFGSPAERLMFMRDSVQSAAIVQPPNSMSWDVDGPAYGHDGVDPSVVRTTRSTLQVVKLKANKVASEGMATQYAELIAQSDLGDGDLYRRLREAAGVSEEEMVDRTKVSVAYIRAIESNRFDRLPQSVYVKGFLRSYFRYLAVPEAERLVAAFSARLQDWQTNKKT